jgi:hypothetical protein
MDRMFLYQVDEEHRVPVDEAHSVRSSPTLSYHRRKLFALLLDELLPPTELPKNVLCYSSQSEKRMLLLRG